MNRLYAWFFTSLVSFAIMGCAVNPATGGANFVLTSEEKEKKIGLEVHENILLSQPVLNNVSLKTYVERVGNDIAALSHRPDLDYTFTILDTDVVNASAAPGGYVYINRGLLALLNSEAELAAVLAHEIAHITARHGIQQLSRAQLAKATSIGAAVATTVATGGFVNGSQMSQITSIWAQSALSGFGREHELEADSLGAEYIAKAGYDPAAMIDLITILKNNADFNRKVAGKGGGYHGLFATHPRNDKRLQEAIEEVATLGGNSITRTDNAEFRSALDGLVVGQSAQSQRNDERNRYYQSLLGYTLVFPPEWVVEETTTTATGALEGAGELKIEAQRLQDNLDPRLFIKDKLGIDNLQQSEALEQFRLVGHTGVTQSADGSIERIAVIYLGRRAMIFRGKADSDEADAAILESVRSFRAIQRGDGGGVEAKIRFVQASEFFDCSVGGQQSRIANYPEETLRLLNNYYPSGTPAPGAWVKLVE